MEPLLTLQKVQHFDGTVSFRLLVTATLDSGHEIVETSVQIDSNTPKHHQLAIILRPNQVMEPEIQHLVKLGNTHPIPGDGDSLTVTLMDEDQKLLGSREMQGGGGTILTDIEEDESSRPFPIAPPMIG